jgi:hypothetical protein
MTWWWWQGDRFKNVRWVREFRAECQNRDVEA